MAATFDYNLAEEVKKYPCLYDKKIKILRRHETVWKIIPHELGGEGGGGQKKWQKHGITLRNCIRAKLNADNF